MKNLAIYLGAGASLLLVTTATAAPLSADVSVAPQSHIQNVRMVCNEDGRAGANAANAASSSRPRRFIWIRSSRALYGAPEL
jgi:hypothetical protein